MKDVNGAAQAQDVADNRRSLLEFDIAVAGYVAADTRKARNAQRSRVEEAELARRQVGGRARYVGKACWQLVVYGVEHHSSGTGVEYGNGIREGSSKRSGSGRRLHDLCYTELAPSLRAGRRRGRSLSGLDHRNRDVLSVDGEGLGQRRVQGQSRGIGVLVDQAVLGVLLAADGGVLTEDDVGVEPRVSGKRPGQLQGAYRNRQSEGKKGERHDQGDPAFAA